MLLPFRARFRPPPLPSAYLCAVGGGGGQKRRENVHAFVAVDSPQKHACARTPAETFAGTLLCGYALLRRFVPAGGKMRPIVAYAICIYIRERTSKC